MEWWQALILGLVEGLTEYLPVSSTGHLLLAERALGMESSASAHAFAICIQAGAVAAVLGLYFPRIKSMLAGLVGADRDGLKLAVAVSVAFLPAALVGVLFDERIEQHLFGLWPVVAAWFVGGAAILIVARVRPARGVGAGLGIDSVNLRMALLIGLWQCLALWPGTSRSLATIVGGVVVGLRLGAAVEFSFLLGLLTLSAATAYKAVGHGEEMLASYGAPALAIGFATAFASAWISVRWMVAYLQRHGLALFGYWRVGLALVVAALLASGRLSST
jgi:undecaprenyl-diphosphatase